MTEARNGASDLADLVRASRLPSVAERKRIRKAADVSLQRMADALDVTAPTVHHWENDRYGPSPENAVKYRKLLEELAKAAGTEIAEAS
jgi:DNA-binding XRE family transcriptional regulator